MGGYHLAQLNVARMRAPLEDPLMVGFASQLEQVFSIADRAEGFVWRLKAREPFALVSPPDSDLRTLVTLSVWESIEALHEYAYRGAHSSALRDRAQWFEPPSGANLALWWIPRDVRPRVEQAMARLRFLERHGATAKAFTFQTRFPPPD